MPKTSVQAIEIHRYENGQVKPTPDLLAAEEPLEIRLGFGELDHRKEESFVVTMRTPGQDKELILGLLHSEGVIQNTGDLLSVKECTDPGTGVRSDNIWRVELSPSVKIDGLHTRNQYMNSSCGFCGKGSIEELENSCPYPITDHSIHLDLNLIPELMQTQHKTQNVFNHTGGLHAVSLFDFNGHLLISKEDIGRHNALDKVIGEALLKKMLPLDNHILLLSGRAGFEMIQKSAMSGCQVVASIGAPSSLAVETAQKLGMTLIGFLKSKRYNIYTGIERINTGL